MEQVTTEALGKMDACLQTLDLVMSPPMSERTDGIHNTPAAAVAPLISATPAPDTTTSTTVIVPITLAAPTATATATATAVPTLMSTMATEVDVPRGGRRPRPASIERRPRPPAVPPPPSKTMTSTSTQTDTVPPQNSTLGMLGRFATSGRMAKVGVLLNESGLAWDRALIWNIAECRLDRQVGDGIVRILQSGRCTLRMCGPHLIWHIPAKAAVTHANGGAEPPLPDIITIDVLAGDQLKFTPRNAGQRPRCGCLIIEWLMDHTVPAISLPPAEPPVPSSSLSDSKAKPSRPIPVPMGGAMHAALLAAASRQRR